MGKGRTKRQKTKEKRRGGNRKMLSANTIPVQAASQCSAPRVGVQLNFNPTNLNIKIYVKKSVMPKFNL
jgi:hypothetical protein